MNNYLTKAALGLTLGATALTAAAPADAQRRWHRGNRGGDVAAGAVLGGIVGLGVGAAIASNNRYYDRGYYYGPPRGYYRGYYGPPPRRFYGPRWRRGYYGAPYGYYGRPYGYGYGGGYYGW